MGKGTKRKNAGVGVDFRKVKHKVGKRLPKPQNETRTDFASRSINLPSQSITADKGSAAVSERNLTLKVCCGCV
jgi:pre-rRNA-processing protein IPI1